MSDSSNLELFKARIVDSLKTGPSGTPLTADSWSGFALVTKEGGSEYYSASLKVERTYVPSSIKPIFQRQSVNGFKMHSCEMITALFQGTIYRIQILYTLATATQRVVPSVSGALPASPPTYASLYSRTNSESASQSDDVEFPQINVASALTPQALQQLELQLQRIKLCAGCSFRRFYTSQDPDRRFYPCSICEKQILQ